MVVKPRVGDGSRPNQLQTVSSASHYQLRRWIFQTTFLYLSVFCDLITGCSSLVLVFHLLCICICVFVFLSNCLSGQLSFNHWLQPWCALSRVSLASSAPPLTCHSFFLIFYELWGIVALPYIIELLDYNNLAKQN